MNEPLTILTGVAAVLPLANVDTDVIVRIERLTGDHDDELGHWAFEALRYRPDGSDNPDFPLNRPEWRDAAILVAGPNFGCGSSREPAVVALAQMGLRCIIAESFGDIFFANCFQNGVLPIRLDEKHVAALMAVASGAVQTVTIDLPGQTILIPGHGPITFNIDPTRKQSLITGLDDIGLTLRDRDAIADWVEEDRRKRHWIWEPVHRDSHIEEISA